MLDACIVEKGEQAYISNWVFSEGPENLRENWNRTVFHFEHCCTGIVSKFRF